MDRIRVLLAVDSPLVEETLRQYLEENAPGLDLVDSDGAYLLDDTIDLLTRLSESQPHVLLHATPDETNPQRYDWLLDQHPQLRIIHLSDAGNLTQIQTSGSYRAAESASLAKLLEVVSAQ